MNNSNQLNDTQKHSKDNYFPEKFDDVYIPDRKQLFNDDDFDNSKIKEKIDELNTIEILNSKLIDRNKSIQTARLYDKDEII